MDVIVLIKPTLALKDKILVYKSAFHKASEETINGSSGLFRASDFDLWLEEVNAIQSEKRRRGVHASTYFSIRKSDLKIVGSVQLRHDLTDALRAHGGHVGYSIVPSERGKGYGKTQLLLLLKKAKDLSMSQVLVTCLKENLASINTVKACGGKLYKSQVREGMKEVHYWIDII